MQQPPKIEGGKRKEVAEDCFQVTHDDDHGVSFVLQNTSNKSYTLKYDFGGSTNLQLVPATGAKQLGLLEVECGVGGGGVVNVCELRVVNAKEGYELRSKVQTLTGGSSGFKSQQLVGDETRKAISDNLDILSRRIETGYHFWLASREEKADYSITIDFSRSENFRLLAAPGFALASDNPLQISGVVPFNTERVELGELALIDADASGAKMMYNIKASKSTSRWEKLERERLEAEKAAKLAAAAKVQADAAATAKAEAEAAAEAERKAREEAERAAKAEAERKAKADMEAKAAAEAQARAKAKEDAERRSREEAAMKERDAAAAKAKAEAAAKEREEAERRAREEAEKAAKAEVERKAKEEADRLARAEAERRARDALRGRAQPTCIRDRKLATQLGLDTKAALTGIRRDFGPINWALFNHGELPLQFREGGSQGLYEMLDHLGDDLAAVAIVRMAFGAGAFRRMKYIFIQWLGDNVKPIRRAQLGQRYAEMLAALGPAHLDITLLGREERSVEAVLRKVEKVFVVDGRSSASGAVTEADYISAIVEEQAATAEFYKEPTAFDAVKKK